MIYHFDQKFKEENWPLCPVKINPFKPLIAMCILTTFYKIFHNLS